MNWLKIHSFRSLNLIFVLYFAVGLLAFSAMPQSVSAQRTDTSFKVMTWNIWKGGKVDGENVGPERVIDVIRRSKTDIVAMQETYGSGEQIAKELGFHFHPRGTNVSIHSRYPVLEDISVFEEFKCVGAIIELPDKRQIAFYSIWLPYNKEIWKEGTRDVRKPNEMLAACQASCDDLKKIKKLIEERLTDKKYTDVPVIIAGDFNSMSHLDYIDSAKDQFEVAIDWPTSHVLIDDGYHDAWRESHPEVNRAVDRTWTPRFPKQEQDRIDFVYYRGSSLEARKSTVIDSYKKDKFPSDHAAVLTEFDWPKTDSQVRLRVLSYNIRHGEGSDRQLDLGRTASLIRNANVDIVGLQEVDNKCKRTKNIDQATTIAKELGMNSAFGSFMKYQGGNYGLAILSRHPIVNQYDLRLPEGREPRVALACEIKLPNEKTVVAVNVHFDFIQDDNVRFEQAKVVSTYLKSLKHPYILLGDFNDVRKSRTLKLLAKDSREAKKPSDDRFTFSAADPKKEIDFLFASPEKSWNLNDCRVLDAPKTSDHRPVLAVFELNEE